VQKDDTMRRLPSLAAVLLASACTYTPYLAARQTAPAPAAANIEHAYGFFDGTKGVRLFEQSWRPRGTEPRAVVVLVHGLKDHSSRYAGFASQLVEKGFAVHALDHRGHGRSAGARAYIDSFDDYLRDLDTFVARVRAREPGRRIFLYGHSMGGAIATLYAIAYKPDIGGLVLSGAALKIDASPFIVKVTRSLGRSSPTAVVLKLDLHKFSHDAAAVRDNEADSYVFQPGVPARTAAELIGAVERIRARAGELAVPLLVMHGGSDAITPPAGSRELVDHVVSADKTLKIFDGFYHDLLHEPEHDRVMSEVLKWLEAHS